MSICLHAELLPATVPIVRVSGVKLLYFAFLPHFIVSETSVVEVIVSPKAYFLFINLYLFLLSNDSTDGEPEEKRRKVANVVINQPATDSKTLVENAPEEVCSAISRNDHSVV